MPAMTALDDSPTTAILDTNVVLDWLVFGNPESVVVGRAIEAGQLRWIATRAMRDELAHVLARGHLAAWNPDLTSLWSCWERCCEELAAPPRPVGHTALRCSDPDDQKFVDLAIAVQSVWLLSRDRAVLRLTRRLQAHGVLTARPDGWRPRSKD